MDYSSTFYDNQMIDMYTLSTSMLLLNGNEKIYYGLTLYGNDFEGLQSTLSDYDFYEQIDRMCKDTNLDNDKCNTLRQHINNEIEKRRILSIVSSSLRKFKFETSCYNISFSLSRPQLRYYNVIDSADDGQKQSLLLSSYVLPKDYILDVNENRNLLGVDAIYIMHWDHGKNRKDKIRYLKEWLGTYNISSLWVTDFDGEALECKDYNCYYPKYAQDYSLNRYGRYLGRGEISLRTKHLFAYYDMIQRNFNTILILEDDAIVQSSPKELKEIIDDAPSDWDIINFAFDKTGTVDYIINQNSKVFPVGSDHHMSCTHGYFINKNGANKLINANSITQNRGFPIDNYIQAVRSVNLYNARDPLITQKWDTNRDHMLSINDNNNDNNEYCTDICNNDHEINSNFDDNKMKSMKAYYSKCFPLYD